MTAGAIETIQVLRVEKIKSYHLRGGSSVPPALEGGEK